MRELLDKVNICRKCIDRFAYKTFVTTPPMFQNNRKLVMAIIRQMAINIHVVYKNFDRMPIDEVQYNMRKNGIKSYLSEIHPQKNTSKRNGYIENNLRREAKAKVLYIHNQILLYVNSNT